MKSKSKSRCNEGKSCGYSCISRRKFCLKDANQYVSDSVSKVIGMLHTTGFASKVRDQFKEDQLNRVDKVVSKMESLSGKTLDINGLESASGINWKSGRDSGSRYSGDGLYGVFTLVPKDKLAPGSKSLGNEEVGVKYGKLSEKEVEILKRVGEMGMGPKLIAARLENKARWPEGMIAMTKVPGKPMMLLPRDQQTSDQVMRAYFKGLSELHKNGISHNDAHEGNVFMHKGKAKFVDFGAAKDTWRAALSEGLHRTRALHIYDKELRNLPIQDEIKQNLDKSVFPALRKSGVYIRDLDQLIVAVNSGKINDELCEKIIGMMYESL